MFWGNVLGDLETGLATALRAGKTPAAVAAEVMRNYGAFVRVRLKELSVWELTSALKKNGHDRSVLCTPPGQTFLAELHAELIRLCG